MKCVKFAVLALAAMLLAVGAYAQATGTIEGRITDETKAALPGVTVEVTSPELTEARVIASDENGRFRVTLLPPGSYAVKFTLAGFATQEQTSITVTAARVVTLQVQMRSAYKEEVTVTGSLIPRPTLEAMSPVTTMNVEDLSVPRRDPPRGPHADAAAGVRGAELDDRRTTRPVPRRWTCATSAASARWS